MRYASENEYRIPAGQTHVEELRAAVGKNLSLMAFAIQGDGPNQALKVKVFVEMETA